MLLHEAVLKARTDLGLSQKKLAELAGIQRKQLATLEKGGNITLATLRKVLVHLPNLETFQLDAVTTTVRREVPPQEAVENVRSALTQLGEAMRVMFAKVAAGGDFDDEDVEALAKASDTFKLAYGWSEEDIRREREREEQHLQSRLEDYNRGAEAAFQAILEVSRRRRRRRRRAPKTAE